MSIKEFFKTKVFYSAKNLIVSYDPKEDQNPAVGNAYSGFNNPSIGKIDKLEYIKFGEDDKMDMVFDSLLNKSATHSGIIAKKAKMVTGNELIVDGYESLGKSEQAAWKAFEKRCGGSNGKSLYNVMKRAAYEYEKSGAFGLDITYDKGFSSIISIKLVPASKLRAGIPDIKTGEITYYVYRRGGFKRRNGQLAATEEKIAAFDTLNVKDLRQLLYVVNPLSNNDYYGLPNYLAAYYFIAADFEFGKHILNSAKNGFTPKVLATFIGRNMSTDEKRDEAKKFKANFTGSSGDQVIVSWVKKEEDAPKFTTLDIQNLDKMISVMSNLDDAKILTAHNVTSPTLFGIMVAGKLGGTGNELGTAYQLFRATETLPNRAVLLEAFNDIISRTKYADKITLEIKDIEIEFGTKTTGSEDEVKEQPKDKNK